MTVLLAAATVVLSVLVGRDLLENAGQPLLVTVPFAAVGVIVAGRQPRNPMGWLLAGVDMLVTLANVGSLYGLDRRFNHARCCVPGGGRVMVTAC